MAWNPVPFEAWNLVRYLGFDDWDLGFAALYPITASPLARERIEVRVATKAVPPRRTRLLSKRCRVHSELDGSKTAAQ